MNTIPDVSIIVPVYNAQTYLKKCINSLKGQNFKNFEIIIVDDGSIDGSSEIIKEFQSNDARIRCISHVTNKGLFKARISGLIAARGKYILYVDADDWIAPYTCKRSFLFAEKYNIDILHFYCLSVDERKRKYISSANNKIVYKMIDANILDDFLENKYMWSMCSKLIRKDVLLNAVAMFDIEKLHCISFLEDLLLYTALCCHSKSYAFSPRSGCYFYYVNQSSLSTQGWRTNFTKFCNDIAEVRYSLFNILKKCHYSDRQLYYFEVLLIKRNFIPFLHMVCSFPHDEREKCIAKFLRTADAGLAIGMYDQSILPIAKAMKYYNVPKPKSIKCVCLYIDNNMPKYVYSFVSRLIADGYDVKICTRCTRNSILNSFSRLIDVIELTSDHDSQFLLKKYCEKYNIDLFIYFFSRGSEILYKDIVVLNTIGVYITAVDYNPPFSYLIKNDMDSFLLKLHVYQIVDALIVNTKEFLYFWKDCGVKVYCVADKDFHSHETWNAIVKSICCRDNKFLNNAFCSNNLHKIISFMEECIAHRANQYVPGYLRRIDKIVNHILPVGSQRRRRVHMLISKTYNLPFLILKYIKIYFYKL